MSYYPATCRYLIVLLRRVKDKGETGMVQAKRLTSGEGTGSRTPSTFNHLNHTEGELSY